MKCNIYDFDKTIYDGDSSIDFYLYCLRKNKLLIFNCFKVLVFYILYFMKIKDKDEVKSAFFSFLKHVSNREKLVQGFFESHKTKIKDFYLNQDHSTDIVISASPFFLLEPFAKYLKIRDLIASEVDIFTGRFKRKNCKGINKVKYLKEKYPDIFIEKVYSDSLSDIPLMNLSNKAYLVNGNIITEYKNDMKK